MEFKVPLNSDDLEIESTSRLYVKCIFDMKAPEGVTALRKSALTVRAGPAIASHDGFDAIYSAAKSWKLLTPAVRRIASNAVVDGLAAVEDATLVAANSEAGGSSSAQQGENSQVELRSAFKAAIYLAGMMLEASCKEAEDVGLGIMGGAVGGGRKKAKTKAKSKKSTRSKRGKAAKAAWDSDGDVSGDEGAGAEGSAGGAAGGSMEIEDYEDEGPVSSLAAPPGATEAQLRASLLSACARAVLRCDAQRMFRMGVPDDETARLPCTVAMTVAKCAPAIKDKKTRAGTVALMTSTVSRFPTASSSLLPQLQAILLQQEHAPSLVAEVCAAAHHEPSSALLRAAWQTHTMPGPGREQTTASAILAPWEKEIGGMMRPRIGAAAVGTAAEEAGRASAGFDRYAVGGVADQVGRGVSSQSLTTGLGAQLLREIAGSDPGASRDSKIPKALATFVTEVGSRCPALLLGNMAVVLALLDSPAQTVRSSVSSSVGSVCLQCFSSDIIAAIEKAEGRSGRSSADDDGDDEDADDSENGSESSSSAKDAGVDDSGSDGDEEEEEDDDGGPASGAGANDSVSQDSGKQSKAAHDEEEEDEEEARDRADADAARGPASSLPRSARALVTARTRDALLDVLAERVMDSHAFTRSATLKAWAAVVEGRALPLARLPRVLTLASGRLLDKASIVRRSACSVLVAMLEGNPFSGTLSSGAFDSGVRQATLWLSEHGPATVRAAIRAQQRDEAKKARKEAAAAAAGAEGQSKGEDPDAQAQGQKDDDEAAAADQAAAADEVSSGAAPTEEQSKQMAYRQYCRDALAFIRSMEMACEAVSVLARSKTPSDTVSAIAFLRRARAFRVKGAAGALRQAMCLAWSPEQAVRDAVVNTFKAVFLDLEDDAAAEEGGDAAARRAAASAAEQDGAEAPAADGTETDPEEDEEEMARARADDHAKRVARGLIRLVSSADEDEKASIEEILQDLGRKGNLRAAPLRMLWEAAVGGAKALSYAAQVDADLHDVIADAWYEAVHPAEKDEDEGTAAAEGGEEERPPTHEELLAEAKRLRPIAAQARRVCARRLPSARASLALLSMVAGALPAAVDGAGGLARLTIVMAANTEAAASARRANSARAEILATSREAGVDASEGSDAMPVLPRGGPVGPDLNMLQWACAALLQYRPANGDKPGAAQAVSAAFPQKLRGGVTDSAGWGGDGSDGAPSWGTVREARRKAGEVLCRHLAGLLVGELEEQEGGMVQERKEWHPAAQMAVAALFSLHARPERLCASILRRMLRDVFEAPSPDGSGGITLRETVSPSALGRLFFVLGEVSVRTCIHAEELARALKRARSKRGDVKERIQERIRLVELGEVKLSGAVNGPAKSSGGRGKGKKGRGKKAGASADASGSGSGPDAAAVLEDPLWSDTGKWSQAEKALDEEEPIVPDPDECAQQLADLEMATRGIAKAMGPLLQRVATDAKGVYGAALGAAQGSGTGSSDDSSIAARPTSPLHRQSVLCICKLAAVSAPFCRTNLPIIFTVLARTSDPDLRASMAVSAADLCFRHPNLLEPWTPHLYAILRDPSARARRHALMALSHLILNDMIRVKGQVAEVAACLCDQDDDVAAMARLFFTELSKRGQRSPVYNLMPDILSCLSAHPGVDGAAFRQIMRFLLGFIKLDRQVEALAEKLARRFETAKPGAEGAVSLWRDLAFCLAQLEHGPKTAKRLSDTFACYAPALVDPQVRSSFEAVAQKVAKAAGADLAAIAQEAEEEMGSGAGSAAGGDKTKTKGKGKRGGGRAGDAAAAGGTTGGGKSASEILVEEWLGKLSRELLRAAEAAAVGDKAAAVTGLARRLAGKPLPKGKSRSFGAASSSRLGVAADADGGGDVDAGKVKGKGKRTSRRKRGVVPAESDDDDGEDEDAFGMVSDDDEKTSRGKKSAGGKAKKATGRRGGVRKSSRRGAAAVEGV